MDVKHKKTSVLMLPWLAHGHISAFLVLAKKLTKRDFYIYFCSSPVNLNSIKDSISHHKYSTSIQLVELHVPTLPELPPHYHTTKNLPPHLMLTLKTAFHMSSLNFSNILTTLNPNLLIYDFLQPWAPAVASSLNIPAIEFLTIGALMSSFITHLSKNPCLKFPFQEICVHDHENEMLVRLLESSVNGVKDMDRFLECSNRSSGGLILIKTFREIEGKYMDYLSVLLEKRLIPVGPLVQDPIEEEDQKQKKIEIIDWLDKKDSSSTVFVSFGSEYFLSKEEIREVAHGLELSKVNFIWVVRFPVRTREEIRVVEEALPEGFVEKIGERGKVVEGWAPQTKILEHSSIGGFVSHCGWSSVMESMKLGVPIIAMPMHLDQPLNARLVNEVGVGIEVRRDEKGNLQREEIAKVIKEVVVEKITREDIRRRARELSEVMRDKGDDEDIINRVVEELVQVCTNRETQ